MWFRNTFLFLISTAFFFSCTEQSNQVNEDLKSSNSQSDSAIDTMDYKVNLAEMGLDSVDSVVLEYKVDTASTAIRLVQTKAKDEASFLIVAQDSVGVQVFIRIFKRDTLVSLGRDQFIMSLNHFSPQFASTTVPNKWNVTIKDTIDFLKSFASLGSTRCSTVVELPVKSLGGCKIVFPDSGSYRIPLTLIDSTGAKYDESISVRVLQGLPELVLRETSLRRVFNKKISFSVAASDHNGEAAEGKIVEYRWDIDGKKGVDTVTTDSLLDYIYPLVQDSLEIQIYVTVKDDDGNLVTDSIPLEIYALPPVLQNVPDSVYAFPYDTVSLGGYSLSDPEGNAVDSIWWRIGEKGEYVALASNGIFKFSQNQLGAVWVFPEVRDQLGAKRNYPIVVKFTAETIKSDTTVIPGKGYFLDPELSPSYGKTIKSCAWSFGGGDFKNVGNTCDTVFTVPTLLAEGYELIARVITSANETILDTIRLKASWKDFEVKQIPMRFKSGLTTHTYKVVKLGSQIWFGQDLGEELPNSPECPVVRGDIISVEYCGRYYDWATAMNGEAASLANPSGVQGICPEGWHLPSDAEWDQLRTWVNSNTGFVSGTDLKDENTMYLAGFSNSLLRKSGNTNFKAKPAGYIDEEGQIQWLNEGVKFWSASVDTSAGSMHYPWTRTLMGKTLASKEFGGCRDCLNPSYEKRSDELFREASSRNNPKQKMLVRCVAD